MVCRWHYRSGNVDTMYRRTVNMGLHKGEVSRVHMKDGRVTCKNGRRGHRQYAFRGRQEQCRHHGRRHGPCRTGCINEELMTGTMCNPYGRSRRGNRAS